MRVQEEGEPLEKFFRHLQLKMQPCQFSHLKDSLLRDQIVYGITDRKVCQRMLREQDPSLVQAVRMCRVEEVSKKQDEIFQETHKSVPKVKQETQIEISGLEETRNAVARMNKGHQSAPRRTNFSASSGMDKGPQRSTLDKSVSASCKRCKLAHSSNACPAFGKICWNCGKKNHFASCCRQVHEVSEEENAQVAVVEEFEILDVKTRAGACRTGLRQ
ncbi:hypothetical protein HPB52_016266 [Rhipicephalus sanguineus]|uniref:CCHC-type domain-containing protein n=1 Tax=Rhipicephalus sanguineus TaxID=34632 RepID=A0A9D4TAQ9_RHISA|nr:hypothetical protein HPB52_016266 [Rhipicephalus sanguineus]